MLVFTSAEKAARDGDPVRASTATYFVLHRKRASEHTHARASTFVQVRKHRCGLEFRLTQARGETTDAALRSKFFALCLYNENV
jgi:hypothetical protein